MKLIILIPSEEYRSYAGARIRYDRVAPELAAQGINLVLADINGFDPAQSDCDGILISKCHDARSLVAAAVIAGRGGLVGVDLFDDYFSQESDSRLLRYRGWLVQLLAHCDFALCSTVAMSKVVHCFRPNLPTHVMNDPAPDTDQDKLAEVLAAKLLRTKDEQHVRVLWFGVGDNPHFPIGLSDLAAFGERLSELRRSGHDVSLSILTNARALTADGLAQINRLPVRAEVLEWSEAAERQALKDSLVAFLPVNAQPFSAAKSLNRAITALSYGCQILSVGFPLYEQLEPLIYRDGETLIADLDREDLRFSPSTFHVYRNKIELCASARVESCAFAEFLRSLPTDARPSARLVLVHGQTTHAEAHRLVRSANGLSVASPYCSARLDYDVIFRGSPTGLVMFVSRQAAERLLSGQEGRLVPGVELKGNRYLRFSDSASAGAEPVQLEEWEKSSLPYQLATYPSAMAEIRSRMQNAFGPCVMILSETARLPFSLAKFAA